MYTLLKNIKELFDLFNCTMRYQKQYKDALSLANEAADTPSETNARVQMMFKRAQRCGAVYDKAVEEYAEAREMVRLALGI